jgi:predicted NAD-dependent protein-ADP-ribosyltransferase YbiA (DUF1768 family)
MGLLYNTSEHASLGSRVAGLWNPIQQRSLRASRSPRRHTAIGRAVAKCLMRASTIVRGDRLFEPSGLHHLTGIVTHQRS